MKQRDVVSLDHKALEDIRIQAVQRVEAGGGTAGAADSRRPPKLTERQQAWVYRMVTQNNPLQLQFEFASGRGRWSKKLIRRQYGVTLSLASVGRLLRSLGLTPQRPVRRAVRTGARDGTTVADGLTILRFRRRLARWRAQIFFADEAGVRSNSHHSGYDGGHRAARDAVVPATGKRFSFNLVSAVSPRGVLRFMVVDGRMTAVRLHHVSQALAAQSDAADLPHRRSAFLASGEGGSGVRGVNKRPPRAVFLATVLSGTQPG